MQLFLKFRIYLIIVVTVWWRTNSWGIKYGICDFMLFSILILTITFIKGVLILFELITDGILGMIFNCYSRVIFVAVFGQFYQALGGVCIYFTYFIAGFSSSLINQTISKWHLKIFLNNIKKISLIWVWNLVFINNKCFEVFKRNLYVIRCLILI